MGTRRFARPTATALGILLVLALDAPQAEALRPLAEPMEAPPLSLPDIRGHPHAIEAYRGRVVLVSFWASWCPPCIVEMPGLQRLAKRLAERPFAVLAVNVGERPNQLRRALKLTGFEQPVLLDSGSETFGQWGAAVLPTSYLIDKAGRIRFEAVGPLDWEGDDAGAAVEALLAEATPTATSGDAACYPEASPSTRTNPGGCRP